MSFRVIVYPDPYGPGKGHEAGYYTNASDSPAAPPETDQTAPQNIWVIGYDVARIRRAHILLLYLSHNRDVQAEAAQNEIPQVWHPTFVRSAYGAPMYGLGGAIDTTEAAAAEQPETPTPWRARRLQSRYNVRRDLLFTANDIAPAQAAAENEIPQTWRGRQLLGRYNVQRHLLFTGDGATAGTPAQAQDEIAQVWRKRTLRTEYAAPTYGLAGANDTSEAAPAADQPDTTVQWRPYLLPSQSRVRSAIHYTLWQGDLASDASATPASPSSPMFIQYAGREYVFRRDLLFSGDTSIADLVPFVTQDEINTPWRKRTVRTEWTTPLYGLNGTADSVESTPFTTQDDIAQVWRKRTVKSEYAAPLYGLNGSPEGEAGATPFVEQPDTLSQWRPRLLPNRYFIRAANQQLRNAASVDDASSDPASPSSPMFVQYIGREYTFRRDLYFAGDTTPSAPAAPAEAETNTNQIGHYRPGQHRLNPALRFQPDTSQSGPTTPEADTLPQWRSQRVARPFNSLAASRLLYGSPDTSQSGPVTPQPDTLVQWKAQRLPNQYWIRQAARLLYGMPDTSSSAPVVPPPTPGGRRKAALWMRRLELETIR